jgi:hypothetical protein
MLRSTPTASTVVARAQSSPPPAPQDPLNEYYRWQVLCSAAYTVLLDLLMLLQLVSLLSQWDYLRPSWPYIPLVAVQCGHLAVANVLQVRRR